MKKAGKIFRYSLFTVLLLLVALWALVQTGPVQNWLIGKVTHRLSRELHTNISIKHVDFSLFNKMVLEGTLVEDRNRDTLLYAGQIKVNVTDWFFLKDRIVLHYIGIDDAVIKLQRKDSVWNYGFLADYFGTSGNKDTTSRIQLGFQQIALTNINLLKKDGWRGEDMQLKLRSLDVAADKMDFTNKIIRIQNLAFVEPIFSITNYEGLRPPLPPDGPPVKIPNDKLHLRWNTAGWDVIVMKASISNGAFYNNKPADVHPYNAFDGNHIAFTKIDWQFDKLSFQKDTISAGIKLSTKERSGLQVKNLSARWKFFPEGMDFASFDLQTGNSHLRNYFSMRFNSFDDMSHFAGRVSMDARFTDANINSEDIAYFAPQLAGIKKQIHIDGNLRGTVDDFSGKNISIAAGNNTKLKGDIHIKDVDDIDNALIEFRSNEFHTSYADVAGFFPALRKVDQMRIDKITDLRFTGDFKGTIHNFTTSGTVTTNLGSIQSDLNMKLNDNKPSVYAGLLTLNELDLGSLLDNTLLGKVSFRGNVKGTGLTKKNLDATLSGIIQHLEFNNYNYTNIDVQGAIANRKFNGTVISQDSNFNQQMTGLVDFSQSQPRFDFYAEVGNINLKNLHFVQPDVAFRGKVRFNFTGNDIDNFLGSARIYDASLIKNGERLVFDSLTVESSIIENNKTITVVSNEFDGAIAGEFSIKDLPKGFQSFLNKYYPSYIKPATGKPANQNFSFVITTKKVDQYLGLFTNDLTGFNNSTITGRIDTKQNLLDLNVLVPEFNFRKIAFHDVNLKGRGNLDSLAVESTVGDVQVSDSLHFPGTHLHINSFNDVSQVAVTTSANQTLTSANLSAQVQTLSDGIKIKFNPSTFDINSKTWTIDRDGELSFSRNVVFAEALRIYSSDQQILISTHPSSEGNWSDVHVDLQKINIGDFTPYITKKERLEGLMTGTVDITDPFNRTNAQFDGKMDQFRWNDDSIGHLQLNANYSKSTGIVKSSVRSDNEGFHFDANALFNLKDSTDPSPINIEIPNIVNTRVDFLEKYIGGIFSRLDGRASGNMRIYGKASALNYTGNVHLVNGGLLVNYTQCYYKIADANVQLTDSSINFGTFKIKDTLGNTATVSEAVLHHNSFSNMRYDFVINTNRMLLLNTKITDNNQFYGTVIGKANFTLRGPDYNMQMNIRGEPTDSSNLYLPLTASKESSNSGFVVWKVYGREMRQEELEKTGTNLTVKLDVYANNYANVFVILDPLTKDIIRANGHGNLQLTVGTTEDLSLTGHYEIDRGSYNFSFQSFIRKPFILVEGVGNYIQWTGNPYDADINIQARYEAENVSFNSLSLDQNSGVLSPDKLTHVNSNVWVIATLTEKLTKPKIAFHIEMPNNSRFKNDQDVAWLVKRIQEDDAEVLRQSAFLVVFNSFGPLSSSNVTFNSASAFSNLVLNSISGAISNVFSQQLSSKFQKVFNDKSIRINFNSSFYNSSSVVTSAIGNYQSAQTLDRTNLNLSVAKSFLNERLTFTVGSGFDIGVTPQQAQASSFQFLPDITAEWKITPSGRLAITFFYRDSYSALALGNHTQNRSGTSLSYRRDFDRLDEVFKGKKKPKTKPPQPPPPAPVSDQPQAAIEDSTRNKKG